MSVISLDELIAATAGTVVRRSAGAWNRLGIDGRSAEVGDLYFAIRGETHDGHAFAGQAVAAGATGVVVEKGRGAEAPEGVTVVEVEDTRVAIGQAARHIRRRVNPVVVGVTGSTGKTTTKGLIAAMLEGLTGEGSVLATEGSLNNETGVPLTLARLRPGHRYAVVEMGMRGLGQIDYLSQWSEPDVGVVVNAGSAHVGVVGSVEAIARGKSEIWNRSKHAVYPANDPRLAAHAADKILREKHVTFGEDEGATVRVLTVEPRGTDGSDVRFAVGDHVLSARVPLVGRHNASNAACALAVAVALGADLEKAAAGLSRARPARQRGEIVDVAGRHVLLDCYNANPTSMRAAIETLAELAAGQRAVAVLGDMLELGHEEVHAHQEMGAVVARANLHGLVTVGARAAHIASAAAGVQTVATDDPAYAAATVAAWTRPGDWILIKASRGMRLERVAEALRQQLGRTG